MSEPERLELDGKGSCVHLPELALNGKTSNRAVTSPEAPHVVLAELAPPHVERGTLGGGWPEAAGARCYGEEGVGGGGEWCVCVCVGGLLGGRLLMWGKRGAKALTGVG